VTDPRDLLPLLDSATARLLATVESLDDADLAAPCALPGWTRAHVVAHLALNGEGLAGALAGAAVGEDVAMYRSQQDRDDDIAALAGRPADELRSRLRTAVRGFSGALSLMPDTAWAALLHRVPGSDRTFRAEETIGMRLIETEIHHADLAAGYTHQDWDPAFSRHLVAIGTARATEPFLVRATDVEGEWAARGGRGPVVSGSVADLGWWLAGRGGADRLEVSDGPMPTIGKW